MICSGLMELAGKMLACSIVHCGFGIAGFAPSVYEYICTGLPEKTFHLIEIQDITNLEVSDMCNKVR